MKFRHLHRPLTVLLTLLATAALPAQPPATAAGHHFLWQVTSGQTTVYLLGSIHFASESIYPLPPVMETAFRDASCLVVEVNLTGPDLAAAQVKMMTEGMYPEGQSLRQALPPALYTRLLKEFDGSGMSADYINRLRPWLAAMLVTSLRLQKAGYNPENGIDMHFLHEAQKQKKPIVELESADFQLKLLNSFTPRQQELFLRMTLEDPTTVAGDMAEMFRYWEAGDAAGMDGIIFKSVKDNPELKPVFDKLITQRNATMTDKIIGFLREGRSCFVVVGAGHLIGTDGILARLRAAGFQVEQR